MASSEKNYVLISSDTHCGASIQGYKPYLPKKYHDDFDRWAASFTDGWGELDKEVEDDNVRLGAASFLSEYNWDSSKRVPHLEADGVVAEILYPNTVPPFYPSAVLAAPEPTDEDYPRRWAGLQAHNRWLADFCAELPGRRKGLAQLVFNDIDNAVNEIRWAKDNGFAGVLMPGDHNRKLIQLYDERLDPIWATCAELDMPVHRHGTVVDDATTRYGAALGMFEAMYHSFTRPIPHLTLGGVFHRHPTLKVVFTEGGLAWAPPLLEQLDNWFISARTPGTFYNVCSFDAVSDQTMLPSEYFLQNCYIASFLTDYDMMAIDQLGTDHVMWGADYPHHEATWPDSTVALRVNFHDVPEEKVRSITSGVAAELYGFDLDLLQPLADRLGPSVEEVSRPAVRSELPSPSICPTFFGSSLPRADAEEVFA